MQTFLFTKFRYIFFFSLFNQVQITFTNYVLLINHFAGDGKSRPAAKGRYKYSNMKKKKRPPPQKNTHNNPYFYVRCVETFNTSERRLMVFSPSNLF